MAGIKCDSCDRKQLVKVNVLRKRVNDSQGMESTYSVWIMAVTNHRSQLLKRKRKRKQLGQSWFSMKSDLLLCIYYYIYIIYILYIYNKFSTSIFSLLANCFRFRFHSVSSPTCWKLKNPLRSISKQVTVICDLWLILSFSLTVNC